MGISEALRLGPGLPTVHSPHTDTHTLRTIRWLMSLTLVHLFQPETTCFPISFESWSEKLWLRSQLVLMGLKMRTQISAVKQFPQNL